MYLWECMLSSSCQPDVASSGIRSMIPPYATNTTMVGAAASPVAFCSRVRVTVNAVTVAGTGTRFSFHAKTIPKLPPPPPQIAENKSSPMVSLSRILLFTSMN
ncbi:hypothetical protein GQ457_04G038670 [Hibiscus cannabinus]